MNFRDLRRPFLRWAMGWPGDSTRFGPPRLPPAKMVQVAEESKNELPELIPVHPPGKIFREKAAIPFGCEPHPAFDIPVAPQTPTYLARVPRGRVLGPTVAILTSGDRMLSDVSIDWGRPGAEHYAYRRFRVPRCKDYQGSALVLACTGSDTYFHWLTDALPRLEIAARAHGDKWRPDFWVVNTLSQTFVRESLALLKIPLDRVIALDKTPHVRFSEVWTPSLPCEASSGDTPSWVVSFLQKAFLPCLGKVRLPYLPKRIWIDRSSTKSRRLVLTNEIKHKLKQLRYTVLRLETLAIADQVGLFHGAEAIAGPHGAGFCGITFSSKANMIEFFESDYINPCYYALGQHTNSNYYYNISKSNLGESVSVDLTNYLKDL